MPQVASDAAVQSRNLPPTRASSARPAETNGGNSPFESLIDDSPAPPPPARDREPPSQRAAGQDAARPPAKAPAESRPAKPEQGARTDRPGKDGADRSDAKPETPAEAKSGEPAPNAGDDAEPAKTKVTVKPEPLPVEGQEAGKADTTEKDETAESDDTAGLADTVANNVTPAVPDPTVGQIATLQGTANAQAQTPATTGAIVAAAAQAAAAPDQGETDGGNASPKARAVQTALSGVANSGGPAAKLSLQSEQPAQAAPQTQTPTPDTDEPAAQTTRAQPAPEPAPDDNQEMAGQKSIAAARGEKPADVQRVTLPETSGIATANTQNTSAQSTTNAAQNLNIPNPASQTAPPAAAGQAAPPAPQTPSPPVPLPGLAVAIAARASAGRNDFSIRLDPPELGRIDVRLSVDKDGQITSHLVADRRDTLALLQRDATGLQRALQDAGFKTADNGLQFSLRDSGQQQQQQQQQQSNGGNAGHIVLNDEMPATDAIPNGYGRYLGRVGGVDIRV